MFECLVIRERHYLGGPGRCGLLRWVWLVGGSVGWPSGSLFLPSIDSDVEL